MTFGSGLEGESIYEVVGRYIRRGYPPIVPIGLFG